MFKRDNIKLNHVVPKDPSPCSCFVKALMHNSVVCPSTEIGDRTDRYVGDFNDVCEMTPEQIYKSWHRTAEKMIKNYENGTRENKRHREEKILRKG